MRLDASYLQDNNTGKPGLDYVTRHRRGAGAVVSGLISYYCTKFSTIITYTCRSQAILDSTLYMYVGSLSAITLGTVRFTCYQSTLWFYRTVPTAFGVLSC